MSHWTENAIFYQIFPLGFCGAPVSNDFASKPVCRLNKILDWISHLKEIGITAVYLGPVFESTSHGYDTADYFNVDRRLGTNVALMRVVAALHEEGLKVIIDGVFNHVGRDFWAFKDVRNNLSKSRYCSWFAGLHFAQKSPFQDPFTYDTWNGHYNLVKLNLKNPEVKNHLFYAVKRWIEAFKVDGLRLDSADCLDLGFISELSRFSKNLCTDFWLMGEVIQGDYNRWVNAGLDSVTNYECYKGLYSSHNDKNYFEIAYSLNRQFGEQGIYKEFLPYSFADNHDVNRVASSLKNKSHLFPLYILLFTMPGIPSIYYGSEWGIEGKKVNGSDTYLRPTLELENKSNYEGVPGLDNFISQLSDIRLSFNPLMWGDFQQLFVNHQQFAFSRGTDREIAIVVVNSADKSVNVEVSIPGGYNGCIKDLLNGGEMFESIAGKIRLNIRSNWGRILTFN